MARRKNWSVEEIVATLRQIEVQIAQGKSIALACMGCRIGLCWNWADQSPSKVRLSGHAASAMGWARGFERVCQPSTFLMLI